MHTKGWLFDNNDKECYWKHGFHSWIKSVETFVPNLKDRETPYKKIKSYLHIEFPQTNFYE